MKLLCGTIVKVKDTINMSWDIYCYRCDDTLKTRSPNHCPKCYHFLKIEHEELHSQVSIA